ncbi:hypothetical protein PVAP13_5NG422440 [Panicum virgatum]|uniref:Uncharacterized protein n=1 Tax=Panicum virgatum TaxID=38727 RepID=A0A8T0RVS8_PANVG|nr:hypothetical protein PVAP13_5NG422440 [Panicum virgatum]
MGATTNRAGARAGTNSEAGESLGRMDGGQTSISSFCLHGASIEAKLATPRYAPTRAAADRDPRARGRRALTSSPPPPRQSPVRVGTVQWQPAGTSCARRARSSSTRARVQHPRAPGTRFRVGPPALLPLCTGAVRACAAAREPPPLHARAGRAHWARVHDSAASRRSRRPAPAPPWLVHRIVRWSASRVGTRALAGRPPVSGRVDDRRSRRAGEGGRLVRDRWDCRATAGGFRIARPGGPPPGDMAGRPPPRSPSLTPTRPTPVKVLSVREC